jgi:hypothetical protein
MTTTYAADRTETQYVTTPAATYAYRRQGPTGGIPLVLVLRFRAPSTTGTRHSWRSSRRNVTSSFSTTEVSDTHPALRRTPSMAWSTG